jgi:hypothetical protein
MTPPRTAAPHVQAALSRTAQARLQLSAPAPGRPSAPHVQTMAAAAQAKIAPPPLGPRPVAAHVQAKLQAPPARPPAPHLPPPLRLPAPPARPAAAQAKAAAPPSVPRPPAPPRAPFLAPPPGRPAARPPAAIQRSAVIQLAPTQVSYFTSEYARRARHYRRDNNVGGRNLATARYRTKGGGGAWGIWRHKTLPSSGRHSEKRLYDFLEGLGVEYQVDWVYTELAPCGSDYHNCAQRLEDWWPAADVYYSVDYPSLEDVSSESNDDDKQTKKKSKAKRRRSRGTATLPRFKTKSRKYDSDEDDEPGPGDFKPPLRRIYSPAHYSSGWEL